MVQRTENAIVEKLEIHVKNAYELECRGKKGKN